MGKLLNIFLALVLLLLLGAGGVYLFAPDKIVEAGIHSERSKAGLTLQEITVQDHTIPYLVGGPKDAPVIVMLHGYAANKDNWPRFAQYFSDSYRVIIPDLPGFGDASRLAQASYDIDSQRQRVEAFIQALDLPKVHIVGNSMGGWLSAALTQHNPGNYLSLGLFDAAGVIEPQASKFTQEFMKGNNLLLIESEEDVDRVFALVFHTPPALPGIAKTYFANKAANDKSFNQKIALDLMQKPYPLEDKLAKITVPSYILWGENDLIIDKSSADVFEQGIPSSSKHIMPNTGHLPMLEKPKQSAELYGKFLKTVSGK